MQISGKVLTTAIDFLKDNIAEVRFMHEDKRGWYTSNVPAATIWNVGDIVIVSTHAMYCEKIKAFLKPFGVTDARTQNNTVTFSAKCTDDIIYILDMVMGMQRQQQKLQTKDWALKGMNQEVGALLTTLSHTKSGMFHRGMNAVKNQANVVEQLMELQKQELQKHR